MKKNSILIAFIIFFLASCGYKPILLNEKNNFNIKKIEIAKATRLNTLIKNSLKSMSNEESEKEISLLIDSQKIRKVTSKDSKGNPQLLSMSLLANVKIYENSRMKSEKDFFESFSYSNESNKFNLSKYEKNIEKNL